MKRSEDLNVNWTDSSLTFKIRLALEEDRLHDLLTLARANGLTHLAEAVRLEIEAKEYVAEQMELWAR